MNLYVRVCVCVCVWPPALVVVDEALVVNLYVRVCVCVSGLTILL